jgi:hypothetical protein
MTDIVIGADCKEAAFRNRDRLRARIGSIHGQDVTVVEDELGFPLSRLEERRGAEKITSGNWVHGRAFPQVW